MPARKLAPSATAIPFQVSSFGCRLRREAKEPLTNAGNKSGIVSSSSRVQLARCDSAVLKIRHTTSDNWGFWTRRCLADSRRGSAAVAPVRLTGRQVQNHRKGNLAQRKKTPQWDHPWSHQGRERVRCPMPPFFYALDAWSRAGQGEPLRGAVSTTTRQGVLLVRLGRVPCSREKARRARATATPRPPRARRRPPVPPPQQLPLPLLRGPAPPRGHPAPPPPAATAAGAGAAARGPPAPPPPQPGPSGPLLPKHRGAANLPRKAQDSTCPNRSPRTTGAPLGQSPRRPGREPPSAVRLCETEWCRP